MNDKEQIAQLNAQIDALTTQRDKLMIEDAQEQAANPAASPPLLSDAPAAPSVAAQVNEGVNLDTVAAIQQGQTEITAEPAIRPSQLEGVSNIPAKSNEQLTAELAELTRRFNNVNMTQGWNA